MKVSRLMRRHGPNTEGRYLMGGVEPPVRGHEQAGTRPVLVFNERSGTVIALAMTSQEPRAGFPLTWETKAAGLGSPLEYVSILTMVTMRVTWPLSAKRDVIPTQFGPSSVAHRGSRLLQHGRREIHWGANLREQEIAHNFFLAGVRA